MRGPVGKWETFSGIDKSESGLVKADRTVVIGQIAE